MHRDQTGSNPFTVLFYSIHPNKIKVNVEWGSIRLQAESLKFESWQDQKTFLQNIQTASGAYQVTNSVGPGVLS